ncbi:MAG: hypothetical protein IPJ65_32915 [Archangiaceae bacterium]|nr:hypothetical protein [Archangiaceae bacterium]
MRWQQVVAAAAVVGGSLVSGCAHLLRPPEAVTTLRMDYTRPDFFAAPFPNEDLRVAGDRIDLSGFPGMGSVGFIDAALMQIATDARGFSTTAGVFFSATDELDRSSLPPTAAASLKADSSVYLIDVERQERAPIDVALAFNGGRFGAPNLLSLVPYQGVPLRESALYVAVVTTRVRDAWGKPIGVSETLRTLERGGVPKGLHPRALAELRRALPLVRGAAAIAVFRTDAPRRAMEAVQQALLKEHPVLNAPLEPVENYDEFCVYRSTVDMPNYQSGTPPYVEGGTWAFDARGVPIRQRYERARIFVTLPRTPMPPGGYPTVVFVRTGGGGDRPLIDHGAASARAGAQPGSGPALEFARAGFAAVMVDGPLGGLRNPWGKDEQFLVFNLDNPKAIRDNIRQSAAELVLTARLVEQLTVDARGCSGTSKAHLDAEKLALFGHSMGATIAPLAMAYEPRFKAAILSGSGGSFIANLLHKQKPLPVRMLIELSFGYTFRGYRMTQGDPALSMLQWALEPADPPLYGHLSKASVLMFQGVVDHYILPPMANAASLALGLDLAGDELDRRSPELLGYTPYSDVAGLRKRGVRAYPVEANVTHDDGSQSTAAVVQRDGDGFQDGHEIVFQTPDTKYQYRCFLSSFAAGRARVVAPSESSGRCGEGLTAGNVAPAAAGR